MVCRASASTHDLQRGTRTAFLSANACEDELQISTPQAFSLAHWCYHYLHLPTDAPETVTGPDGFIGFAQLGAVRRQAQRRLRLWRRALRDKRFGRIDAALPHRHQQRSDGDVGKEWASPGYGQHKGLTRHLHGVEAALLDPVRRKELVDVGNREVAGAERHRSKRFVQIGAV